VLSTSPAHLQPSVTAIYADLIPQLATMARALVRDLDPQARCCGASPSLDCPNASLWAAQNDLQFLRIRSREHEVMVYAGARRSKAFLGVAV
jgi:hypothetical protein